MRRNIAMDEGFKALVALFKLSPVDVPACIIFSGQDMRQHVVLSLAPLIRRHRPGKRQEGQCRERRPNASHYSAPVD